MLIITYADMMDDIEMDRSLNNGGSIHNGKICGNESGRRFRLFFVTIFQMYRLISGGLNVSGNRNFGVKIEWPLGNATLR